MVRRHPDALDRRRRSGSERAAGRVLLRAPQAEVSCRGSGHWPMYQSSMFQSSVDEDGFQSRFLIFVA